MTHLACLLAMFACALRTPIIFDIPAETRRARQPASNDNETPWGAASPCAGGQRPRQTRGAAASSAGADTEDAQPPPRETFGNVSYLSAQMARQVFRPGGEVIVLTIGVATRSPPAGAGPAGIRDDGRRVVQLQLGDKHRRTRTTPLPTILEGSCRPVGGDAGQRPAESGADISRESRGAQPPSPASHRTRPFGAKGPET